MGAPPGLDPVWSACPDSPIVADAAAFITEGLTDPRDRLRAIESFLKLGRIYDTGSAGGQTIASVERFLGQNYAKGNLEVFVTTFALLARCAGVPVRVVVGYPAPAADDATVYAADQIDASVETPIAGVGWWAVDPLPNESEQQRQAELAAAATPPDPVEPSVPEEEPVTVVRTTTFDRPVGWQAPLIAVGLSIGRTHRRRRGVVGRRAPPHGAAALTRRRPGTGHALRVDDRPRAVQRRRAAARAPPHRVRDGTGDGRPGADTGDDDDG